MTDRTVTAGVITEASSDTIVKSSVGFVLLDFDSDPVYVWTGTYSRTETLITEGSHTYLGIGSLGAIDGILESANRSSTNGVTLQMNGVGNDLLANALGQNYQGRAAKIWVAFLDSDEDIVPDPLLLFGGQMDVMSLVDGDETGLIQVQCESREATLSRNSESLLTDEEQQRIYPGDLGLEFVLALQGKTVSWGEGSFEIGEGDRRPPGQHPRF